MLGVIILNETIQRFDDHTDYATKVMLQKLLDKKNKYEQLKKQHLYLLTANFVCSAFLFIFVYITVLKPNQQSFYDIFSKFISNQINLYVLLAVIASYSMMMIFQRKRDEMEIEFHTLRCEIISKSSDLWSESESWKSRNEVFRTMKDKFDINLYYESK